MRCEEAASALVEDRARLAPEVRRHLEECAACRAVLDAHEAARTLARIDPVPALPSADLWAELERRRRARFAWAGAGVAVAAMAALVTSAWLRQPESELGRSSRGSSYVLRTAPSNVGAPENRYEVADAPSGNAEEEDDPGDAFALAQLVSEVRGYMYRDTALEDFTYTPFGALAAWVAPPDNESLEAPGIRSALDPITYPEEVP